MKQLNNLSNFVINSILLFKEALVTSFKTFTSFFTFKKIDEIDINRYLSVTVKTLNKDTGPFMYTIFFKPPEYSLFHILDIIQSTSFKNILKEILNKSGALLLSFQFISNIQLNNNVRVFEHTYQHVIEDFLKINTNEKVEDILQQLSSNIADKIIENYNSDLVSLSTINIIVTVRSKKAYLKDFENYLRKK